MRHYNDIAVWKNVSPEEWINWHWQNQHVITTLNELEQVMTLTEEERSGVIAATTYFKMRISPHIVTLMKPDDAHDPLRRQFIPSVRELDSIDDNLLFADVNADDRFSPVKGLVHRYPSKVLIFPSNYCGAYCRYCFRRKLARDIEDTLTTKDYEVIFDYLRNTSSIEEVIFSGGDPLVIGDDTLEFILESLSHIPHIQIIRFHTRLPVTIPYRITPDFLSMLARYKSRFPIFFVLHIDSPAEFSEPMCEAIDQLIDHGFLCFASCPLLKGINDNEVTLRALWTGLLQMRIKPYYLFQSDPVKGLRHFLVPISKGLEIMHNLYDRMSGLGIPLYCFNVPDGGGHVLLNYNYVTKMSEGKYSITTFEGNTFEYTEDVETNYAYPI